MKKKGRKGTPVNLSISDKLQEIGYRMANHDKRSLTGLVEYLLEQEAFKRGIKID